MKKNKIIGITRVKNEEDIIESFIRYTLLYCDFLIIVDNFSSDKTLDVILELKKEYSERLIIRQKEKDDNVPLNVDNDISIEMAISKFGKCLIIPLDGDEFLTTHDYKNPKEILETLSLENIYYVNWTTFVFDPLLSMNNDFVPLNFMNKRNNKIISEMMKVIIGSLCWEKNGLSISLGNHDVICGQKSIIKNEMHDLTLCHYPVRSEKQIISKINKVYLYDSINPKLLINTNYHIKMMYKYLEKNGSLSREQVLRYSLGYSSRSKISQDLDKCIIPIERMTCYDDIKCSFGNIRCENKDTELCNWDMHVNDIIYQDIVLRKKYIRYKIRLIRKHEKKKMSKIERISLARKNFIELIFMIFKKIGGEK